MKILLLQFREDQKMSDHEFSYFLLHAGLTEVAADRVTAMQRMPTVEEVKNYDALILGGSGEYLISKNDIPEVISNVEHLLKAVRKEGIPILGICFGAHIIARAFGGEVINDESRAETGTFVLRRNPSSDFCPLLSNLPQEFDAQFGHKDHVVKLPEGSINLASTDRSEIQAFTFPGELIYGVGFHPELNKQGMYDRFEYYADEYHLVGEVMEAIKKATWETPVASTFLKRFLEIVVGQGKCYEFEPVLIKGDIS